VIAPNDARIVVVRCATKNDGVAMPRLGWLMKQTRVALVVRLRMYGTRAYQPHHRTLPADALVRDATPRERTLGYVADPVEPPAPKAKRGAPARAAS